MAIAAAIMTAPPTRPTAGDTGAPAAAEKDDTFSKVLEAEREATDDAVAPAAQAPRNPDAPPAKPTLALAEITAPIVEAQVADVATDVSAAAAGIALALGGASKTATATTTQTPVDGNSSEPGQAVEDMPAANPANAAVQVAQATTAVLMLGATGEATKPGSKSVVAKPEEEGAADGVAVDAALMPMLPQPQSAAPAAGAPAAPTLTAPAAQTEGTAPAAAPTAPAPGALPDPQSAAAPEAPAGESAKTETLPANAASANAAAPAIGDRQAAPADAAVKTAADAQAAPSQPATANAPAIEVKSAATTSPVLQSAPAATIQVYNRIIERADGRAQRFEIRLDPAELGRVDVRIEIGADKRVHAVLAAHDSAALSDLMRGQRSLETALKQAGLDLADNGVRFELSTDSGRSGAGAQGNGDTPSRSSGNVWRSFETADLPLSEEAAAIVTPARRSQRLDLVA